MLDNARIVLLSAVLLACGGSSSQTGDTNKPVTGDDEPDVCKVVDSIKATAKPKPKESGCIDKAVWEKMSTDCKADDAAACYQIGVCLKLQSMGKMSDEEKEKHLLAILATMRKSCDAGIAAACVFRSGVISEALKDNPGHANKDTWTKEKCTDLVRACNLGDENGGCYSCRLEECK